MADYERDQPTGGADVTPMAGGSAEPPKKFPKGVILDKDGKP